MSDSYFLSGWRRRICRVAAVLFLASSALYAVGAMVAGGIMLTHASTPIVPGNGEWSITDHPESLLPEEDRAAVTASPAAARRYAAWLDKQDVRAELTAATVIAAVPFVLFMLCVGRALWRIGAPGTRHLDVALRDLRWATLAALFAAVSPPLRESVLAMVAYPGTPEGPTWYLAFDAAELGLALLLAIAAWIVTWAIAEGSRAARALDDFV